MLRILILYFVFVRPLSKFLARGIIGSLRTSSDSTRITSDSTLFTSDGTRVRVMFEEQAILLLVIVLGLWFVCGVFIGSAGEVVEVTKEVVEVKKELRALSERTNSPSARKQVKEHDRPSRRRWLGTCFSS